MSKNQPKPRILFITLTNIGDVVMTNVLLDRILHTHPDAIVDIVAGPAASCLYEGLPNLGEIMPLKKRKHHLHYYDVYKRFKDTHYDVIVDLRTPFLSKFLKGDTKLVFKKGGKGHRAEQMAEMWPQDRPLAPKVWIKPEVFEKVTPYANKAAPYIALAPTANWIGKQWPQKYFAELIERLSALPELNKTRFIVFGAPNERNSIADLLDTMPKGRVVDMVGKTSLQEVYAWLTSAQLFIGNDSGTGHMASAAGIPTLTLFGPMRDDLYRPVNPNGKVLVPPMLNKNRTNLAKEALPRLISDLTVDMVFDAVCDMLGINPVIDTKATKKKA